MARLRFIQGAITGRLGEFVGSRWKGINYIRTYAVPANPRTEEQISIRLVFKALSLFATFLFKQGLLAFIPPARRMTERNSVFKANRLMLTNKTFTPASLQVSRSNLPASITGIDCGFYVPTQDFTFEGNYSVPTGYTDMKVHCLVYDFVKGVGIVSKTYPVNAITGDFGGDVKTPIPFDTPDSSSKLDCRFYAFISAINENKKMFISQTFSTPLH